MAICNEIWMKIIKSSYLKINLKHVVRNVEVIFCRPNLFIFCSVTNRVPISHYYDISVMHLIA